MSVAIRLRRMGAKKRPFYRIVVVDSTGRRSGKYIESVGHYNPITDPAEVQIDAEKTIGWLEKGAIPTNTTRSLLTKAGIYKQWREQQGEPAAEAAAE